MSDIHMILKLNKEIDDFIKNQSEVLRSFERERPLYMDKDVEKLFKTLRENIGILKEQKDIILGLEEK